LPQKTQKYTKIEEPVWVIFYDFCGELSLSNRFEPKKSQSAFYIPEIINQK